MLQWTNSDDSFLTFPLAHMINILYLLKGPMTWNVHFRLFIINTSSPSLLLVPQWLELSIGVNQALGICYGLSLLLERDLSDTSQVWWFAGWWRGRVHHGSLLANQKRSSCVCVSLCLCWRGRGEVGKSCGWQPYENRAVRCLVCIRWPTVFVTLVLDHWKTTAHSKFCS